MTVGLLTLAGCQTIEDLDPYRRTDVWYPTGAPVGNLAVMVANPQDLIHGRGVQQSSGKQALSAINHVVNDQPKTLLDPASSSSGGGSGGGGSGAGGGASGGGAGSGG